MKLMHYSALFAFAFIFPLQPAAACQDGYTADSFGLCWPTIGGDIADTWERMDRERRAQTYGPGIATWLQGSRETAYPASQPIPADVRSQLTGFVPEDVLNRARYKVDDSGLINAAANILHINSNIAAVTLVDVIVFRNAIDAQSNYKLWAHELKHVRQYMDWGTLDFGRHSARNYEAEVEQPALDEGERYASWHHPTPPITYPPPPRQATICVTPNYTCRMDAIGPVGVSCWCPTQYGPLWGISA